MFLLDGKALIKSFVIFYVAVTLPQKKALFYLKCLSTIGETKLAKVICKIWKLKSIASKFNLF